MSEEAKEGNATSLKVTGWWLVWTTVVFLTLLALLFLLLFQWGGFEKTATADGTRLAAGVLAVAGTLLTASITFVGLLLRLAQQERAIQIDSQAQIHRVEAEARRAEAQERVIQIQTDAEARHSEAEARLHMEAAIQAVRLMGDTSDGNPVSNGQRGGAIYALANLGQMPLAFVLLEQLWGERKIDPAFGVLIVNDVLAGDDDALQRRASRMLLDNADALWTTGGAIQWPTVARDWSNQMSVATQSKLAQAMLKALVSKSPAEWGGAASALAVSILYALLAWPNIDPALKQSVAKSIDIILGNSPVLGTRGRIILMSGEAVSFAEITLLTTQALKSYAGHYNAEMQLAVEALQQHVANG